MHSSRRVEYFCHTCTSFGLNPSPSLTILGQVGWVLQEARTHPSCPQGPTPPHPPSIDDFRTGC
eukprot:3837709-Prymnesium_polylepis.1